MNLSFDRIADRYDSTRGYPEDVMEEILGALQRALPRGGLVLDAGVGTGRFAKPLQDMGILVVGIDISRRMLQKAKEKGTENLLRADMCSMPFGDGVFQTVLSIHVLHLISTWRCALVEVGRVATEKFMSVAFNKEESPAEELRRFYDKTCADLGYTVRHPGMRERELPDQLPPDRRTLITVHEHPISTQDMIDDFERRTYSSQWMVPDEIHQAAIEALRREYEDVGEVIGRESISLLEWSIDRVWEFASGPDPALR